MGAPVQEPLDDKGVRASAESTDAGPCAPRISVIAVPELVTTVSRSFQFLEQLPCPCQGTYYKEGMQIIALRALRLFWETHPQAETPLRTWYALVSNSSWAGPADIKDQFGANVDFVADNRVIFDIGGNKFRLVVHVAYRYRRVLVKFVGTHRDYDKIDPATV